MIARHPRALPAIVLVIGLLLSAVAALLVDRNLESQASDRFERDSAVLAAAVEAETHTLADQLAAAGAFYSIGPRPSQEDSDDYLAQVGLADSRWLRDLGWAEAVSPGDVPEFLARERAENPDFRIIGAREEPGAGRDLAVITRGSRSGGETLIGLDIASFGPVATRVFEGPLTRGEPWFARVSPAAAAVVNQAGSPLTVAEGDLVSVLPTRDADGTVNGWLLTRMDGDQLLSVDESGRLRARLENRDAGSGVFSDPLVAESGQDRVPDGVGVYETSRSFRAGGIAWTLVVTGKRSDSTLPALLFALGGALALMVAMLIIGRRRRSEMEGRLGESERRLREDSLTGLPNRLGLEEALASTIAERSADRLAAALFLDIDRFKLINDSLGHAAGDELLVSLASRLTSAVRRGDVVGRFGGDEFLVVIRGISRPDDATAQARRIATALEPPLELSFGETQIHASIGIRIIEDEESDPAGIIRDADLAMFDAKRSGTGIRVFDSAMRRAAGERLILERALIEAVAAGDLNLEYQPIVDVQGRLAAVEGLLRWHHRELGQVPPAHFLPVAEEVGLMGEIGRQVVREAIAQAARWNTAFATRLQVAINVTGAELYDPDFPRFLEAELRHHDVPPGQIMLEISEELLLESATTLRVGLDRLRELGVGLALDDFGTGRSSLSQAGRLLDVAEFKLDRTLILGVDRPEGRVIVRAASDLAAGLGQRVVAEGVEQPEQRDFLIGLGIGRFQGFLYSPSVPAARISGWLAEGTGLGGRPVAPGPTVGQPSS